MCDMFLTAPDGSFTITKDEAIQAFAAYDQFDWQRFDSSIPADAVDTGGLRIDRHNPNIKIWVMAESLLMACFGPIGSVGKANEYLSKYKYFEPMITTMINTFEKHKAGQS